MAHWKKLAVSGDIAGGTREPLFSPDHSLLVTMDLTATPRLHLWDAKTLREGWAVASPDGISITDAFFSSDGTRILECTFNQPFLIDARDGSKVASYGISRCGDGRDFHGRLSPDGKRVLGWFQEHSGRLTLWDAVTGKDLDRFGKVDHVASAAFSPDGSRVLAGCADGTARLLDLNTGDQLDSFSGHDGVVTAVAFSPDGKFIATGCEDVKVRLFRLPESPATGDKAR